MALSKAPRHGSGAGWLAVQTKVCLFGVKPAYIAVKVLTGARMRLYLIDDDPERYETVNLLVKKLKSDSRLAEIEWENGFQSNQARAWRDADCLIQALDDPDAIILLDMELKYRTSAAMLHLPYPSTIARLLLP